MYQSQIDQRAAELEAADKRMDAHGEIITDGDLRAWERHLKDVAGIEDVKQTTIKEE